MTIRVVCFCGNRYEIHAGADAPVCPRCGVTFALPKPKPAA